MFNRRGQNVAEYSILIALVIAAAVAMQTYVKRGLQGRVKDAVDNRGATADIGGTTLNFQTAQYEPYYASSNADQTSEKSVSETTSADGQIARSGINEQTAVKAGSTDTVLSPSQAD